MKQYEKKTLYTLSDMWILIPYAGMHINKEPREKA